MLHSSRRGSYLRPRQATTGWSPLQPSEASSALPLGCRGAETGTQSGGDGQPPLPGSPWG
jgi:hypothetical protein